MVIPHCHPPSSPLPSRRRSGGRPHPHPHPPLARRLPHRPAASSCTAAVPRPAASRAGAAASDLPHRPLSAGREESAEATRRSLQARSINHHCIIVHLEKPSSKGMESDSGHTALIHGLPDEIALICLARVPRRFHNVLRCVSRRWRALLCSEEWHVCRKRNNMDEPWIYVICRETGIKCYVLAPDHSTRSLRVMHIIEPPCSGRQGVTIEALDKRLFLLGGCSWLNDATDEVYCYDGASSSWSTAAPMPTARCYFVSASLNDKLYVTGGLGLTDKSPNSWDIYDSSRNSWSAHKNPMLTPDIVKFVALDEKLVTIHRAAWNRMYFAGIYDPLDRTWRGTENEIALCYASPSVVVDGTLYMLQQTLGTKLMMWQKETKEWVMLGRLSDKVTRPPCELVAIGRKIYVIGRGLSIVTIDVDTAARVDGFLVTSSAGPLVEQDLTPERCRVITI